MRGNEYGSQLAGDKTSNCDSLHAQETLARLINAMASVKTGRDYICKLFTWKLETRKVPLGPPLGKNKIYAVKLLLSLSIQVSLAAS